ncbi:MAG: ATP-binding protein [Bacteroidota bacterium]
MPDRFSQDEYVVLARREGDLFFHQQGVLAAAMKARKEGKKALFVHPDQTEEAAIVNDIAVYGLLGQTELNAFLAGEVELDPVKRDTREIFFAEQEVPPTNMADIIEDENIKHALEIAIIGHHHTLLYGDIRSGKTRLVEHLPGILPRMKLQEALQITLRYSETGELPLRTGLMAHPPLRKIAPFHDLEEVNQHLYLAHHGILMVQDIMECSVEIQQVILQVLRNRSLNWGGKVVSCQPMIVFTTTEPSLPESFYPFVDLYLEVEIIAAEDHLRFEDLEHSLEIRDRVEQAVAQQDERFEDTEGIKSNGQIPSDRASNWSQLDKQAKMLLTISMKSLGVSPSWMGQILRVARSIADRVEASQPLPYHVAEAVQYIKAAN